MHLALVSPGRPPALLRDRAGDFVQQLFAESSGYDGEPDFLSEQPFADCSNDSCVAEIARGDGKWRILATRSGNRISWADLTRACAEADIAVSDRRLPRGCTPKWLKLDRTALRRAGGVAIYLGGNPRIQTVAAEVGEHPWAQVGSGGAPHRKFVARRVNELKTSSAGKAEDRFGNDSAGAGDGVENRFQIVHADHR
jgi:competence protein ComEC